MSIVSFVLVIFLLLSFAILPADKSQRHYLSVGLLIAVCFIEVCPTPNFLFHSLDMADIELLAVFHRPSGHQAGPMLQRHHAQGHA